MLNDLITEWISEGTSEEQPSEVQSWAQVIVYSCPHVHMGFL